jgi:RNA ligase
VASRSSDGRTLRTREAFREGVFTRDGGTCVCCAAPAVDAHHILERRLFSDGGYYLDNGASLCASHHLEAERTTLSPDELRSRIGIQNPILPSHFYADQSYDKWGNVVLSNGTRLAGELFHDTSVQKALSEGKMLPLFTTRVKYNRTHHLPWSPGLTDDDRMLSSLDAFAGQRVIVTEKMDGENTSMYSDGLHARSVDSGGHPSRNWIKKFHASIQGDIPEGWRICGENLFAKHSIEYLSLPSFFMGFSIWNDRNVCLSWDESIKWFTLLGITPVPVLYDGVFDLKHIQSLWNDRRSETQEGYVVRVADSFSYGAFRTHVGKFVRPHHVQTVRHWMHGQPVTPNRLAVLDSTAFQLSHKRPS